MASYVKLIIYEADKTTSKYPTVDIISCFFKFPLLNLPTLNMINPIIARTKAIFCKSKEIDINSSVFIPDIYASPGTRMFY